MERRMKRNLDNKREKSQITWITWIMVAVGILTFMISYTLYGRRIEKISNYDMLQEEIGKGESNFLNMQPDNSVSEVNLSIGKSINEIDDQVEQENNTLIQEDSEKLAINTSTIENNVIAHRNDEKKKEKEQEKEKTTLEDNNSASESSIPIFIRPVSGEIIKDFSRDNLIYSNTLEEWTTHLGIDFKAEKTSIVKASADGVIKSIKNDPRYGLTVLIEHENGFVTMYSNLLSTEFVSVGESVKQGQTIATVGNTAIFEIADETHLHFEIIKDGLEVDPNLYLQE